MFWTSPTMRSRRSITARAISPSQCARVLRAVTRWERMEESNVWRNPIDLIAICERAFESLPVALEAGRHGRSRAWSPPNLRFAAHPAFHEHLRSADERRTFSTLALEKRIRIREHQRVLQDFVHVLDLDQRDILQYLLRDLIDVLLVFLRHEDGLDAATMRREHLLLEPANRQHPPAQRDLARHR